MRVLSYTVTKRERLPGEWLNEYRLEMENNGVKMGCSEIANTSVPEEIIKRSLCFSIMERFCDQFMDDMEEIKERRVVV